MRRCLVFFLATLAAALAPAAINPPKEAPEVTAKEMAQGFRDGVILARPKAVRRASVDADEAREGVRVREKFARFGDLRIIELAAGDTSEGAVRRLRATDRYDFVEPDFLRHIGAEPNDPRYADGSLWALKNTGLVNGIAGADIKAPQAWDIQREAPGVIVAVIDTGVNLNHQDIAANLWVNPAPTFGDLNGARFINGAQSGTPTDDNGHGTHVAGTIGAIGDNGLATTGVAWKVQIMAIKSFPASGTGSVSDIARGINYAVARGAHIINASYGETSSLGFSQTELAAVTAARNAGVIFVAAAGNASSNMDVSRFYPASHALDNVVSVGASARRDERAPFSNYGAAVDLFAPGSEILSLDYNSNTGVTTKSGTSMAAPHVAGALALLKARFPSDNYRQLINRLLRSVDPVPAFAGISQTGGRLNLLNALQSTDNRPFNDDFANRPRLNSANVAIRSSNRGATAESGESPIAGNPAGSTLWWQWTAPTGGLVSVDTAGSAYDTVLAVYNGSALSALTLVASNDDSPGSTTSRLTFNAQGGATYQIAVDGKGGASGLTLLNLGTTPANDLFASPVAVSGESAQLTATNAGCSRESGEPRIAGFGGGKSLWYRWTAPRSGRFQWSVFSNDFDPLIGIYTGTTLASLVTATESAGTTQTPPTGTLTAVAGATYLIAVDTRDATTSGTFTLTVTDSLWQASTTNNVPGSPAIGEDGSVYIGSTDRSLYAFAPDGSQKWSYATGGLIDTCSPAIGSDGTIYVGSNDGNLYAFTSTGSLKWTRSFGAAFPSSNSPAIAADGTIYMKAGDSYLYALNPGDGSTRWRINVNDNTNPGATSTYASPAIAPDGTIYQGSEDKKLYAINPDGTLKWRYTADNDIYSVPAIDAAGNVYFTVLITGRLHSVAPDGRARWVYSGAALGSSSSPALSPDGATAYYGGYDGKLHAVNTATGAARWTFTLGGEVRASSPAVDENGTVYIGCYDYKLYAINPNGTLKRTWDTGNWIRSAPGIYGNTLYVGSNDHKVYAFDIGAGAGGGPWPQYRHNARKLGRAVAAASLAFVTVPQSQSVAPGQSLTLTASTNAVGGVAYQWYKDGSAIPGATASTYTITAATSAAAGRYTVTVAGAQGAVTSPAAIIAVEALSPGRLVNFSIRTTAGAGSKTLIVGFVLQGSVTKPLLLRGIGPTLRNYGVGNALNDPELRVYNGGTLLTQNGDWGTVTPSLAPAFASAGAFELPVGSKDAALALAAPAGASTTVQLAGADGGTGIALAEIYDTDSATATTRLVNVSARAQVNTGEDILIAGFTISGNVPVTVLVRGVGPSLAPYGVTDLLSNPRLEVYRGSTLVSANDNWSGTAAISTAAAKVGAFPMLSTASADAAVVLSLAPGTYTAQVSGVGSTTGVALVEVYEVP